MRTGIAVVAAWCVGIGASSNLSDAQTAPRPEQRQPARTGDTGDLEVLQLRPNFFMIAGAGGHIGVQVGDDGVVVVDAGSAARADAVVAAIKKLTPRPIRYVINTSADPDHVGGNETISKAGQTLFTAPGSIALPGNFLGGAASILVGRESADADERADRAGVAVSSRRLADRDLRSRRGSTCISTAKASRSCISRRRTPTAMCVVFFRRSDVVVAGDILDTTRFPVIDVARGGTHQRRDRGAQSTGGAGDSVRADRLARGRHARDPGPRPRVRSVRRRGIPRHGHDHSRPRS